LEIPPDTIMKIWNKLKNLPGGRKIFSRSIGFLAPYTGTIGATMTKLENGHCQFEMNDTRRVRNHLKSVHAVALMNLGEVTSGIAFYSSLPEGYKGIPIELNMKYLKKARGKITADSNCSFSPPFDEPVIVSTVLKNEGQEDVAKFTAKWKVNKI